MMLKRKYQECSEDEYIRINHDKGESDYLKVEHHATDGLKTDKENNKTEYRNEKAENEKYNDKVTGASEKYFCVFRIGKKFKNFSMLQRYQYHVTREGNVLNADPSRTKENLILIGSANIVKDVQEYIKDIPMIRSNANIGFDMVLTAHHEFFDSLTDKQKENWINHNIEYLKNTFGDNCISAICHKDETSVHIHSVCVPKFWNQKQLRYELQSNKYIDGSDKMQKFQTDYSDHMQKEFPNLMRGIKGSKRSHISIKKWYSLTGEELNIKNKGQILAYAQKAYLLEKRTKALEETLIKMQENKDTDKLLKRLKYLEKDNEEYKEITEGIIKKYEIKEDDIKDILDKVFVKNNDKERTK